MLSFIVFSILTIILAILAVTFTIMSAIKKENKVFTTLAAVVTVILAFMTNANIDVPAPIIYPLDNDARVYNGKVEVEIEYIKFLFSHTYYSLDGSDPKTGNIYEGPLVVTESTTVAARNRFLLWWSELSKSTYRFENMQITYSSELDLLISDKLPPPDELLKYVIYIIIIFAIVRSIIRNAFRSTCDRIKNFFNSWL